MRHHIMRATSDVGGGGIPTSGLVLEYTMDNLSGGYVIDGTGNRDALIEGTPAQVPGQVGQALAFDGDDDCLRLGSIGTGDDLQLLGDFTIAFWINAVGTGDGSQRIIDKSTGGNAANGWALIANTGGGDPTEILFLVNGAAYSRASLMTYGSSQFICVRCTSNTVSMFSNNVAQSVSTPSIPARPNTTTDCAIASWNHSTGRELNGWLDQFRIYNRALSAAEMTALYNEV